MNSRRQSASQRSLAPPTTGDVCLGHSGHVAVITGFCHVENGLDCRFRPYAAERLQLGFSIGPGRS